MSEDKIDKWNFRHAILMILLVVMVLVTERIELLSLGPIISFSLLFRSAKKQLMEMSPPGGYANWVTGFRLILILICSFLFGVLSEYVIFSIMLLAVFLDFLDGFLARKYNHSSTVGNFFDMEVDAFFVLLMCFYFYSYESLGWWILIPGVLRYFYKVVVTLLHKPNFKEKKRKYASYIAGIFFVILLGCILFPYGVQHQLLMFGSTLIVVSFGISFIEFLNYKPDYSLSE